MIKLLCFFGIHKWEPIEGTIHTERKGKWEVYEYADGICTRCGLESTIRKEVW